MKALFTTFPAYGHLLSMISLAKAAAAAGDEVVFAAAEDLRPLARDVTTRALGPSLPDLLAENAGRSGRDILGFRNDESDLIAETVALFTTTRADMAFGELCELAAEERPDVIVAEMWDYVAPLVARRLGIPWVSFVHSPATPVDAALEGGLVRALEQRGLTMPTRRGTVQLWPEWLESEQVPARDEAVFAMQEVPFNTSEVVDIPAFHGDRPVVLVTLGTVVDDLALLNTAVRAVLDAGADALVMTGFTTGAEKIEGDSDRVRAVPFAPMAQLLDRVQAVIGVGGSGTTLSALSRGLPLAFVPRMANNPQVASVVAGFGAGVVCDDPVKLTEAVPMLLNEPELRARAQDASDLLGRRAAPGEVWSALRNLIGTTGE